MVLVMLRYSRARLLVANLLPLLLCASSAMAGSGRETITKRQAREVRCRSCLNSPPSLLGWTMAFLAPVLRFTRNGLNEIRRATGWKVRHSG